MHCFVSPHSLIFNISVRLSRQNSEKTSDFYQLYKIPVNDLKTIDNLLTSSFWGTFYQSLLQLQSGLVAFYVCCTSVILLSPFTIPGVPFLFLCCIGSPVSWIPYLSPSEKSLKWLSEKGCRKDKLFWNCMSEKIFYLHTWCGWWNSNFVMISP